MNSLLIVIALWFVFSVITNSKKKKGATGDKQAQPSQPHSRQQQAIEEQRRRRAAYEAAQSRQQGEHQTLFPQESHIENAEWEEKAEPHHIDEEEERRCAEAEARKAAQRLRKRELLQRYGSLDQRQSQKARPASLEQVQQLYTPVSMPQVDDHLTGKTPASASADKFCPEEQFMDGIGASSLPLRGKGLVQAIVMAEILGQPRAKRRLRG